MDFHKLLSLAGRNKDEAKREASVKQYSTECGPAKKPPKSNVQSSAVKQFLAKQQLEEKRKVVEAQKKREELLSLRAQSSKNNKKAKIMASRTKDNDFSRIRLTDDEVEAKKKREAELIRLSLNDTVQRMKARINLEEKEKLLPKKRKRKSKQVDGADEPDNDGDVDEPKSNPVITKQPTSSPGSFKIPKKNAAVKRPLPPPGPSLSFHDLLKVAQQKQFEPVVLQKKVKDDDRPLTKKEKLQRIDEENRRKRKMGLPVDLPSKQNGKVSVNGKKANVKEQAVAKQNPKSVNACNPGKQPTVIHIQKDSRMQSNQPNQGMTKKTDVQGKSVASTSSVQNGLKNKVPMGSSRQTIPPKSVKQNASSASFNKSKNPGKSKESGQDTGVKKQTETPPSKPEISEELLAIIENRIRSKIQQELEAKLKLNSSGSSKPPASVPSEKKPMDPKSAFRTSESPKLSKSDGAVPAKKPPIVSNPRSLQASHPPPSTMKKGVPPPRPVPSKPPPPRKPAFHPNPYLQPPRRLLEGQRPQKRQRLRLESDEEEDDMSDFIDDDDDMNGYEEDVSGYIKEIFGYDRAKFANEDDLDDVLESSFDHQMREEKLSARLGLLEDLDDIRKEKEEEKRRKMKAKTKKKKK